MVTAILAGYAFAFLEFPFKRTLFVVFLATLMVPFEVTIVTNVTTISDLGLVQHLRGLAVPFLATGFGAFLMRQAFLQLPERPAGRRRARRLRPLAVPDAGRGAAGAARGRRAGRVRVPRRVEPVPVAAARHQGRPAAHGADRSQAAARTSIDQINITFAGAVIAVIPLVILLLFFQKQLVRGLTAGAVKG